jgi:type IV secretory pathway VirB10-like protein
MEDLGRWSEEAPELLGEAKAAHAELGPSAAQLDAMLARIERALPSAGGAARSARAHGLTSGAWKLAGGLISVLVLLGAAYFATRADEPAPVEPAPLPVRPGPVVDAVDAAPAPPSALEPPAPPAAPELPQPPSAVEPPTPRPARATPPSVDPAAELALLERARRTVAHDPARALALTDEHRQTFRPGLFAEERELLAIEALIALGRRDAATRRTRAFERTHPNSVHAHRLAQILRADAP